jgi:hypothetical protein
MATVFMQKIVEKVYNSPAADTLRKRAEERADVIFTNAVAVMKDEFETHPITQEIRGGETAANDSGTLRGGQGPTNNLFSFIGFENGTDPTKAIEPFLDPSSSKHGPQIAYVGKDRRGVSIRFQFKVKSPDEKEVWKATPLPWGKGFSSLSWAKKIETGIQGFAAFLSRGMDNPPSRSHGGIQLKNKDGSEREIHPGASYVPPTEGYLQTIFARFLERIKKVTR